MVFDTVIRGAQVIDGSGGPIYTADVGILNGRIHDIAINLKGVAHEVINAAGLHLAPGFIDVHTHDDINVIDAASMPTKISQGVTTVIVGNCGISASPVHLTCAPPDPLNLLGQQHDFCYPKFSDYVAAVIRAQPSVNVGALVGHTAIRNNHMSELERSATAQELAAMCADLRQAMDDGALGLSSGLAYANAKQSSSEEVQAMTAELGRAGGIYTTHLRTEFDGILEAMDEAFITSKQGKVPLVISHLKCAGKGNWNRSEQLLNALELAAKKQTVGCDCYPYAASSSTLDLAQVTNDTDIFITWSEAEPDQAGRYLHEIAQHWQCDLIAAAKRLQPAGAVYYCMAEQDVANILRYPRTMIGSDGLPNDPHPHPRLWGTFPRVIGHYSRDTGLLPLPEAVHKMSGLSAKQFQLNGRGEIKIGNWADLVLFDYQNIRDLATFTNPKQVASGIEYVWVNGVLSYRPGQATPGRAGQFLFRQSPTTDTLLLKEKLYEH
ncbi:N-acyl-D-amino-acid deacylase family protein [Gilvimarinus polysaccharolyticus]|uniref:N-acyl-D-amino-acid deacylase family protein n=1 Tax=Gilvimarinus polysaccharolyticus TaxID=863921 RepID=UPI000673A8DB|nr:D-aminoacylase [Gilvimarinus polysaccharolyticus]